MSKKEFKTSLILIIMLFITMLVVSGGTFAYLQWQTSDAQKTALNVTVTDDINMTIDPAAVTKTGMRPTNNCGGDYAMSGTSTVTITNNTGVLARPRFKLKIKITDSAGNNITNQVSPAGQKYMYYVKYAVSSEYARCTNSIVEGRFNLSTETSAGSGWYDSPTLTLDDEDGFPDRFTSVSFNALANDVTSHRYKVTVWIDSNYTTVNVGNTVTEDKLQNATITVSWSENSTVEQVREKPAYAVYSTTDSSLRFYRSATPISEGSTYNGRTATAVYTGFEEEVYNHDDGNIDEEPYYVPWFDYASNITSVVFEDPIMPISVIYWFDGMSNCANLDVSKLYTSSVTIMGGFFKNVGSDSTTFTITGLENFDVSNVTDMYAMFKGAGSSATTWSVGDISGWDVLNVTNMSYMFEDAGDSATTFLLNLSEWNVSNVTGMGYMFHSAGYNATNWSVGDISEWDVSNVSSMEGMFSIAGKNAEYLLDLSGWNVCNVKYYTTFNYNVTSKITAPNWGMACPT